MDRQALVTVCMAGWNFLNEVVLDGNFSDDEDEDDPVHAHINNLRVNVNNVRNIPSRIRDFIEITIANSNDKEFQSHFRLTRGVFDWLLRHVGPSLRSERLGGRQTVDPKKQLLVVLWLLATPDSYRSIANRFNMGKSTLSHCLVRVVETLNEIAAAVIVWPNAERRQVIKTQFARMAGLQGVVGAIDGTYIKIKAPKENPRAYTNRKCFTAITLQAICDHSLRFIDCFAGYPSSVSDVRIFRNSDIHEEIMEHPERYFEHNQYIIGDKAYPIYHWCIPPYIDRGNLDRRKTHFNTNHAKTRQVVERSFALLFGRFRRLRDLDMNRIDLIAPTIIAACVLHNVCLNHEDDLIDMYVCEGQDAVLGDNDNIEIPNRLGRDNQREEGIALRDQLARNV